MYLVKYSLFNGLNRPVCGIKQYTHKEGENREEMDQVHERNLQNFQVNDNAGAFIEKWKKIVNG